MKCPSCNNINLDERTQCYHCSADLTVLRTVIIRAKHHYNTALEHAERSRLDDAIAELKTAVSIYNDFPQAHNVLGTLYAKQEKWDQAIVQWQQTLNLEPTNKKAADYLFKAKLNLEEPLLYRQVRLARQIIGAMAIVLSILLIWQFRIHSLDHKLQRSDILIKESKYNQAYLLIESVIKNRFSYVYQSMAIKMQEKITQIMESKISTLKDLLGHKEYEEALNSIQQLRKSGIPKPWNQSINEIEISLYEELVQREIAKSDRIFTEKKEYWTAKKILEEVNNKLSDQKLKDRISQKITVLKNDWIDQNYKLAVQYQQNKDFIKMEATIFDLQKEQLDSTTRAKLVALEKQSKIDTTKQLFASAKQLLETKQFDEFLKLAGQIDITFLTSAEKQWLSTQVTKIKNTPKKTSLPPNRGKTK